MTKNQFLTAVAQHDTYTENGAVSHSTTGNALLDYFSKAGTYRDRALTEVSADMGKIWAESPMIALQILFYLRLITRDTEGFFKSTQVQRGQGNRDEFRKAMFWVATNYPNIMDKNMWLIPVVGCWKDLWHEDLISALNQNQVFSLIKQGMNDPYNATLLAKYLPKIRSRTNTFNNRHKVLNNFAKNLCKHLGWSEKDYRKFKRSGTSHQFQRDMSNNLWKNIDYSRIPGKALFSLTTHKGRDGKTTIERHGLEKTYLKWLQTQPVAKFTGHVYELGKTVTRAISLVQRNTINKQFDGLLELARKNTGGIKGNVWCALDTSGSMGCDSVSGVSALDICKSLGVYFSSLNEGTFKDHVIMFDDVSRVLKLRGTFCDKMLQLPANAMGGTNFQSVIDEIVRIRTTRPEVPLEDYPDTLLIVSDMQFNCTGSNKTNYEKAMSKLAAVGLPNMRVIWWFVTGRGKDFPGLSDDPGMVMISGFDGAIITSILGGEQTTVNEKTGKTRLLNPHENMLKALNQEVLTQIKT